MQKVFHEIRLQVEAWIAGCLRVTYHSHRGRASNSPFDIETDTEGVSRKEGFDRLRKEFPDGEWIEIGLIDRLREETLAHSLVIRGDGDDVAAAITRAENEQIVTRFKSAVVSDFSSVDLVGSFDPSDEQIHEAEIYLTANYPWYKSADRAQKPRYVDHYLRSKYLPPVDRVHDKQMRAKTIEYLNRRFRFFRVIVPVVSYVDVYLNIVGYERFEYQSLKKIHPHLDVGETLYLEIMDRGCSKELKKQY
jgi:hypothetical protein